MDESHSEYHSMTEDEFTAHLKDNAEFSNIEVRDVDIVGITAYNLVFRNCRFVRCGLREMVWENVRAFSSTFIECDFLDSNFEDAVFEHCRFFHAETSDACRFGRARLRSATFTHCRLSSCSFEGADLVFSVIEDSDIVGTDFWKAQFGGSATLTRNACRYANFRGADFSRCDVSYNDFVWAVLDEVNFEGATLIGSNLSGASLRFAKFSGADARGAVLGQIDVRTTDLEGVKVLESQMRGLLENCGLIIFPDGR